MISTLTLARVVLGAGVTPARVSTATMIATAMPARGSRAASAHHGAASDQGAKV
jgi:hypothetical protein